MAPERVILCGEASARDLRRGSTPLVLRTHGPGRNVNLQLEAVRRNIWTTLPPVLNDLVDVAVYVYAADQAIPRAKGGQVEGKEIGAGWRRNLRFRIPVRVPDLWNSKPVRDSLVSVLSFLSEDEYTFEFPHLKKDISLDGFLDFDATPFDGTVEEVVMFSGGLDSLAGAVTESVVAKRQVLLVNHRSTEKLTPRHQELLACLDQHAGDRGPLHFPVRANKQKRLGNEFTQRTRSFLFAALGTMFARICSLDRLRFYENGVVSLNLPLSAQVVGARASRTTHPRVLTGMGKFLTALLGRPFAIENPFLWDTKTDVVKRIADAGCGELIGKSISCGHTLGMESRTHTHCGVCSQCIDRRFAVLAAGQAGNDPATTYSVDLLTGDRNDGEHKTMLAGYLDLVERVEGMGEADFLTHFGEVARVLAPLGLPPSAGAARVFDLYKRHASQVRTAINAGIAQNADAVGRRRLPRNCLLRLVCDEGVVTDAVTEPLPKPEGNYFLRRGAFWAIRFQANEERIYPDDRGFQYLRILFGNSPSNFTASELASQLERCHTQSQRTVSVADASASGVGVSSGVTHDVLDDDALEAMVARLREIELQRPIIEASDSPTRMDDLDEMEVEERAIRDCLGRDRRLDGRSRQLGDVRNLVRNRVCNAIKRALKLIFKYDKPLFNHLTRPILNLGHTISYVPRQAETWTMDE